MNSDILRAIETITRHGAEAEVIRILAKHMEARLKAADDANAAMQASLRIIRKINKRGRGNKTIDALCDYDSEW